MTPFAASFALGPGRVPRYAKHPRTGRSVRVPYVAMWDSERAVIEAALAVALTPEPPRLVYQGRELPSDRDGFGVLWARCSYSPGVGRPDFASMHPGRQYECMYAMRCQVCGGPADRNKDGWLFFDWRNELDPPSWPEGTLTAMPPLCAKDARLSMAVCPKSGAFTALRVRAPRLWGVGGVSYRLTLDGWRLNHGDTDIWLPKDDPGLPSMLASKLIRELRKVTPVNPHDLRTAL
ncbi:hypothetical protein FM076_08930 [Streptomyces albus subsp. chlorinus]|uniref:hypothetical protein n=1 Tax=Streptomyces albus TaxID=1888 RepID=UPI00156D73CE|nr:hypothetical protein [Streptomyces albus]NSC21323.1 hypothetical protein [Streptomyces albus subsp. chlorinus]